MIEIDNLQSTVSDHTLRMVLLFCGQDVKDKLLYEGEPAYGFHQLPERNSVSGAETRLEPNDYRRGGYSTTAGEWSAEDHPAPLTEAIPP